MAKPSENPNKVTTFLPNDVFQEISQKAHENGMTASGYIRMLVVNAVRNKASAKA